MRGLAVAGDGAAGARASAPRPRHHRRRRGDRRRHRRRHDGAAAARGGRARRAAGGRPDRPRRDRPHDGQGLLAARARCTRGCAAKHGARRRAALRRRQRAGTGLDRGARQRDAIDCDFRRRAAYVYSSDRSEIEDEADAALEAGCPRRWSSETPLPYPVAAAVRFDRQAEFHAQQVPARAGRAAARGLRAHPRRAGRRRACRTPGGRVRAPSTRSSRPTSRSRTARWPSPACTRSAPTRSPAGSRARRPRGCSSAATRRRAASARCRVGDEELLIVGGEGHRPGTGGDTEQRYRALEAFAREHWDVRSVEYRWSAQDNTTVDGLPFVGRLTPVRPTRAHGHRLRQVGDDQRHRRRARAGGPRARPRERVHRSSSIPPA